jgi:hypothetical protein
MAPFSTERGIAAVPSMPVVVRVFVTPVPVLTLLLGLALVHFPVLFMPF